MPTELVLRPAEVEDARGIAAIHLAARAGAAMPPGIHSDDEVRARLVRRLGQDEVWVAEIGGILAGYARLTPTWLDDLYVAPSFSRQGIGSALLELVKAQRPGGFCLWVFEMNQPARAFYRRHGLVELERSDGTANEERCPDLRLAWPGNEPLTFLRGQIDEVEHELCDLLARRDALTRAVQVHTGA